MIPLRHADGDHINEEKVHEQDLKEAYARHIRDRQKEAKVVNDRSILADCLAYLKHAQANDACKTHFDRCDILFDPGLPGSPTSTASIDGRSAAASRARHAKGVSNPVDYVKTHFGKLAELGCERLPTTFLSKYH